MKPRQTPAGGVLRKLCVFLICGLLAVVPTVGSAGSAAVVPALQPARATGSHPSRSPSPPKSATTRSASRTGAQAVSERAAPASPKPSAPRPGGTGKNRSTVAGQSQAQAAATGKTGRSATGKRSGRQQKSAHPPANATPRGPVWRWPVDGRVITGFNPGTPGRKGIRLSGEAGQTVRAAAAGTVIYVGKDLPGYGRLIVLQHGPAWVSAYGYLGQLLISEGTRVKAGQPIARLGAGRQGRPGLHFEIRRQGQPVNPLSVLPRR